jgi:hypothetical protein
MNTEIEMVDNTPSGPDTSEVISRISKFRVWIINMFSKYGDKIVVSSGQLGSKWRRAIIIAGCLYILYMFCLRHGDNIKKRLKVVTHLYRLVKEAPGIKTLILIYNGKINKVSDE